MGKDQGHRIAPSSVQKGSGIFASATTDIMGVCSRPSPWELHGKGVGSHAFIVDRAWPQDGLSTNPVSGSGAMRLGVAGFGASPSTAEDANSGRTDCAAQIASLQLQRKLSGNEEEQD